MLPPLWARVLGVEDANIVATMLEPTCHILQESLHPTQSFYWAGSENKNLVHQARQLPHSLISGNRSDCSAKEAAGSIKNTELLMEVFPGGDNMDCCI